MDNQRQWPQNRMPDDLKLTLKNNRWMCFFECQVSLCNECYLVRVLFLGQEARETIMIKNNKR